MEQRADYKNWIPRGMIDSMCAGTVVLNGSTLLTGEK